MAVYILHFDRHYHHARHYIGYTKDVSRRVKEHQQGDTPLLKAVLDAGIQFQLARVYPDKGRDFERRLKRCKQTARYCPLCYQGRRIN